MNNKVNVWLSIIIGIAGSLGDRPVDIERQQLGHYQRALHGDGEQAEHAE